MRANQPTAIVGAIDPSNVADLGLAHQIRLLQDEIERLNSRANELELRLETVQEAYSGGGQWAFPKVIGGRGISVTQTGRRISIERDTNG